ALPDVVVLARLFRVAVLRVDHATNRPQRTGPALDPDDDTLVDPAVVATCHDSFGEAPGCCMGLHAATIQSRGQWGSSIQSKGRFRSSRRARRARSAWRSTSSVSTIAGGRWPRSSKTTT